MEDIKDILNSDIAARRLPMTIILSIYLTVGLFGNSLVLFIYAWKINRESRGDRIKEDQGNNRYYIPSLALFDLIAVISQALSSIIQNEYFVEFPTTWLCKGLWFIGWCSSVISGLILLLIAIQRFLCIGLHPSRELSIRQLRILLAIVITVAFVCTAPTFSLVNIRTISTEYQNQTVSVEICSFRNDEQHIGTTVYFIFMLIGTVLNMIATSTMYVMIGRVIYTKFRKSSKGSLTDYFRACVDETNTADITEELPSTDGKLEDRIPSKDNVADFTEAQQIENENAEVGSRKLSREYLTDIVESKSKSCTCIRSSQSGTLDKSTSLPKKNILRTASARRTRKVKKARTRFTSMFLCIVVIYVISYIPPFIVQFATGNSLATLLEIPSWELNVILFFEGSVLINHLANPFVYGYFDALFRRECRNLFCR